MLFTQAEAETGFLRRIFDAPAAPVLTVDGESFTTSHSGEPTRDDAAIRREGYRFGDNQRMK